LVRRLICLLFRPLFRLLTRRLIRLSIRPVLVRPPGRAAPVALTRATANHRGQVALAAHHGRNRLIAERYCYQHG